MPAADAAEDAAAADQPAAARPTVVPFRRPEPATPAGKPEPLWRELAGKVLRDERNRQERTLGQVAERAGISPQYLSEVERGRKEPSSEMLASICGALGLTLADLLSGGGMQLIRLGGPSFGVPSLGGSMLGRPSRPGLPSGPVLMAVG